MKFLLLLTLLLLCGCQQEPPTFDRSAQTAELLIEKEGLEAIHVPFAEFAALKNIPSISYQDSLHGAKRRYLGLRLAQLQQLAKAGNDYTVVKFHCRDGYVSEVPIEVLQQGQFLLAFRDLDAAPNTWLPVEKMTYLKERPAELNALLDDQNLTSEKREALVQERDRLMTLARDMENLKNQGPFYPVFIPGEQLSKEKSWNPPFCVNKVVFAKDPTDRTKSEPDGLPEDHPAVRGSKQFQQRCAVCHSINGIGGAVGPELNRPMSVVEYWDEVALRQVMKDPSKVRGNSRMPPLHLKDPTIDDILAYLNWMAGEKRILD